MNAISLSQLLLKTDQLIIKEIMIGENRIWLAVESKARQAKCPKCQQESKQIHSTYMRYPADLAWAEWAVILQIQVKRFFCHNESCPKRTFAERFPDLVAPYARRTDRVVERQQQISLNVCAHIAEKLLLLVGIGISDTTVNRLLRDLPDPKARSIRVLGIDDWAKRKGQQYGTILVDLERGQVIDLLGDRTAETVTQWLKEHPGIEIVSRDRSKTYADAINRGAPKAVQVADRWHLLKNLSDTVFRILDQEHLVIKKQLKPETRLENRVEEERSPEPDVLTPAEQNRKVRIDQAIQLYHQGWFQKDIARHFNIHPRTVRRYLKSPSPKIRRHRTGWILDPFKAYIIQRWNEGCHNAAQIFREIEPQGYAGSATIVRLFVQQLRKAHATSAHQENQPVEQDPTQYPPTLRSITGFILRQPDKRSEDEEEILSKISAGHPKLATTIQLARAYADIIRQQQEADLDAWLKKANKCGYRVWRNFATSIYQDIDAIRAALLYPWSNGPTVGHVNRLKFIKRQMYGRAMDDLLRKRVLWQGRWSFT